MAKYPCLDYESCLRKLDTYETGDLVSMSYAFRPLTKHGYLCKGKDGFVTLTAKGRKTADDIEPLVSIGSGSTRARVAKVARMAMRLSESDPFTEIYYYFDATNVDGEGLMQMVRP